MAFLGGDWAQPVNDAFIIPGNKIGAGSAVGSVHHGNRTPNYLLDQ